ncbi:hypothetical protein BH24DEI1_BH24DEI1_12910 [soil metagenome]|jgi:hypothetical protein
MFLMILFQTLAVWLGSVLALVFVLSLPELLSAKADAFSHRA